MSIVCPDLWFCLDRCCFLPYEIFVNSGKIGIWTLTNYVSYAVTFSLLVEVYDWKIAKMQSYIYWIKLQWVGITIWAQLLSPHDEHHCLNRMWSWFRAEKYASFNVTETMNWTIRSTEFTCSTIYPNQHYYIATNTTCAPLVYIYIQLWQISITGFSW